MNAPAADEGPAAPARIRVDVVAGRARLTALDHNAYLSPRLLRAEGTRARIALVANCATLLAGDRVGLLVDVGPGAVLELSEPAATVAYNGRGGHAEWAAGIRLETDARLIWHSAPFVVAAGASVDRNIRVDIAGGAVALIRDCLVLGRGTETDGGALQARLQAGLDDAPLLIEHLDLRDPRARAAPGILGGRRVLVTAMLLGAAPAPCTRGRPPGEAYQTSLAGPGALARATGHHAHEVIAAVDPIWKRWLEQIANESPKAMT